MTNLYKKKQSIATYKALNAFHAKSSSYCTNSDKNTGNINIPEIWSKIYKKATYNYLDKHYVNYYLKTCCVSFNYQTIILEVPNLNYYQGFVDKVLPALKKAKIDLKIESVHFTISVKNSPNRQNTLKTTTNLSTSLTTSNLSSNQNHSNANYHKIFQNSTNTFNHSSSQSKSLNISPINKHSSMGSSYTFDNFVKGESNKFCLSVCQNIPSNKQTNYNPLFIHGNSGLGKTHLLNAIANETKKNSPESNIILTSTDNFTNEFFHCIRTNKQSFFKKKYHMCDMLLVDDVQFISGKTVTQEEFFHVFNVLHERKKQIILASDRCPNNIKDIQDRLRNRFQWGISCDIKTPDINHRAKILLRKSQELSMELDIDIAYLIADYCQNNIRQLEGALKTIVEYASFNRVEINKYVVDDLLKEHKKSDVINIKPCIKIIQLKICEYFNISIENLTSNHRSKDFIIPRQIGFYLCRELAKSTFNNIAKSFGGKNHTTVMHGVKKISQAIKNDRVLSENIEKIKKTIYKN